MSLSGRTDIRLVPAAFTCWVVAAVCLNVKSIKVVAVIGGVFALLTLISIAGICAVMLRIGCTHCTVHTHRTHHASHAFKQRRDVYIYNVLICVVLCAAVGLCAAMSASMNLLVSNGDIIEKSQDSFPIEISAAAYIDAPVLSSSRRGFSCSATAHIEQVQISHIQQKSNSQVVLYMKNLHDCHLQRGAAYQFKGKIRPALWGKNRWWVDIGGDYTSKCVSLQRKPSRLHRVVEFVQSAFLTQTRKLNTSGRILVPGIALGVMGNDALASIEQMPQEAQDDQRVAKTFKEHFKTAGIMHILAVSGGHFAFLAGVSEWISKHLRVPRLMRAAGLLMSIAIVSLLMYPSDSLIRAQIMGLFSLGFVALGRRRNSCAALCWMILVVLIVSPIYALSIGFMLSCSAVLGILILSESLARTFHRLLPQGISQILAVTVSAQLATLPISLVLSSQLPVYAVLANLLVAVPMDIATEFSLVGLFVGWLVPWLGSLCVWCAGLMCAMMAKICDVIAQLPGASVQCSLTALDRKSVV